MRILVTGASGFIGLHLVRELIAQGHEVTCCVRNVSYTKKLFPTANIIAVDFIKDTSMYTWMPRVENIDVVINTVGILDHPIKKCVWKIHYNAPKALFQACEKTHVKKIIQISALGIDTVSVAYAKSKKAAEEFLLNCTVPSFILRPSLVYGREWHGGMAMLLTLSSIPGIIPLPGKGQQKFQPIYVDDLCKAISNLVEKPLRQSVILHSVSHDRIKLANILQIIRSWLHLHPAKMMNVPLWMLRIGAYFGDFLPASVLNTTAYKMMMQNNITTDEEAEKFVQVSGVKPRSFQEGVFSQACCPANRWQAALSYLRPLAKVSLAFMWFASAFCSAYFYPVQMSYAILNEIGVTGVWQPLLLYGASFLNAVLGILVLSPYVKLAYWVQLITIITYTIILTFTLPAVWVEPFGSVVKNIPIIMLIILLMAVEE